MLGIQNSKLQSEIKRSDFFWLWRQYDHAE